MLLQAIRLLQPFCCGELRGLQPDLVTEQAAPHA